MLNEISGINRYAHIETLHPNLLPWQLANTPDEMDFLSRVIFGAPGHEYKACAYIYKELGQLTELEMQVSSVLTRVLAELQSTPNIGFNRGGEVYHALSCFAAEEIHHANTFYQYVRRLSGQDYKIAQNLYSERMKPFEGNDSPLVKLSALCATAYVGESVMTIVENRMKALDPDRNYFLTNLLHLHGLDEARHIRADHFVFDHVVPSLSDAERRRMHEIINQTEDLNTRMAIATGEQIKQQFGVDYTQDNPTARVQLQLTLAFRQLVQGGELIRKVDDHLDTHLRKTIREFSYSDGVHVAMAA